jgi:hypothetical protein
MSISLLDRGWYCWKQPDGHRGKTPHRLIQALLGCSFLDAESIVKSGDSIPDDVLGNLTVILKHKPYPWQPPPLISKPIVRPPLRVPEEFRPIENIGKGRMFVSYLEKRGFDFDDIPYLVKNFNLRYCVSNFLDGAYDNRLIFLITMEHQLVSWTGRHIGQSRLRYNSLSVENPILPARLSLKDTVLWYDWLRQVDGGTLVVNEGPFDSLKLNYLGNPHGIYATCVYGSTISDIQLDLLTSLNQFKNKLILLDAEAAIRYECNFHGLIGPLEGLGFKTLVLPDTVKDPGELNTSSFTQIFGC